MAAEEVFAGKTTDLNNGQLKEITVGEKKIVLAKADDNFFAVDGICPHLKAPLAKGALCSHRLYCPWHHSSFDITTGQLCDPPAMDSLQRYAVRVENDEVFIQTTPLPTKEKDTKAILSDKTFVIAGGGAAGMMAAQTLRAQGFTGKLIMITKEAVPPYDRTMLSKKFLSGKMEKEKLPLREADFFEKHRIDLEKNRDIQAVDVKNKTIHFTDNRSLAYDTLLVATGGAPNPLELPGANLDQVYTLRSQQDAEKIIAQAKALKKVAIIGSSFIGMEAAASLVALGLQVTVIAKDALPFEKNFGKEIGNLFLQMHQGKGVIFKTSATVNTIEKKDEGLQLTLQNGDSIDADLVIVGIGVHPETDFLRGLQLNEKDKSMLVNEFLQAADGLFAAGDIARFTDSKTGKSIRVEHWRLAEQHGEIAAFNMLGKSRSIKDVVPFFWTNQFDQRLSYLGHAEDWDEIVFDGSVDEKKFLAFYLKADRVQAVASMGRDVESNKIEDAMRKADTLLTLSEIKELI